MQPPFSARMSPNLLIHNMLVTWLSHVLLAVPGGVPHDSDVWYLCRAAREPSQIRDDLAEYVTSLSVSSYISHCMYLTRVFVKLTFQILHKVPLHFLSTFISSVPLLLWLERSSTVFIIKNLFFSFRYIWAKHHSCDEGQVHGDRNVSNITCSF